jgi:hypothetical protein
MQTENYFEAPRPALPAVFAPEEVLPAGAPLDARARPIEALTRRCSSGVSCKM